MKAAVFDEFGGASVMQIRDIDRPEPESGQVLIEVHAASINPIDWKIREGMMTMRFGEDFPQRLGMDASGVVKSVGADVSGFKPGDEVIARSDNLAGKCYAEFVAVNEGVVAPKPSSMSHTEAGALPLAGLTALIGLRDCGELQAGQRVLIVGGSGGVGTYAVQIAKNMGAHVTAVCSGKNHELVKSLGADELIDYTCEEVFVPGVTYDVVYDTIGAHDVASAQPTLTDNGVYLTLVPVAGVDFFIPGQTEREAGKGYFVAWTPSSADLEILNAWVEAGKLHSVIDSEFSLEQIREAHERSETLHAVGKIVLNVKE
ncbi:MAG: NADP-dependent oxidoreductase [Gammaproteobacteria bacterium]